MDLIEKSTGKTVQVPDEEASEAFASGQYGVKAGQAVPIRGSDGSIGTVDPQHLQDVVSEGGQLVSAQEYKEAAFAKKHAGIGSHLAATGEGVARGLTLGLSDPLAVGAAKLFAGKEAGEHVREHLAEEKEAHSGLAIGSELAGAAIPLFFSGGATAPELGAIEGANIAKTGVEAASLGARAADVAGTAALAGRAGEEASVLGKIGQGIRTIGAAPRAVSAAGDFAEHAIGGLLGEEATTALGRAGQSAARTAARSIVEGGLFGGGEQISESTLKNEPLTAEKLFSSIGHSALTAGLIGGALGGVGTLAKEGAANILSHVAPKLEDLAGEQAWKWLGPGKKLSETAEKRAGGTEAVGRTLFDRVIRPLAEEEGLAAMAMDNETKLGHVRKATDSLGKEIGSLIEGNAHATSTLGDILKPINDRIEAYSGKVLGEDKVHALQNLKESITKVLGGVDNLGELEATARKQVTDSLLTKEVPIAEMIEQRRALQQIAFQESKSLDPKMRVQLLREVTGEWNALEEKTLNKASEESGEAVGTKLRGLNKDYQRLKLAEEALEKSTSAHASNRHLSLSDNIWGAAEGAGALAAGHGAGIGALGAMGVAYGHKMLREHGNVYASLLLDRLATFGGVSKAAAEVNASIDSSVSKLVSNKRTVPRAFHVDTSEKRFQTEKNRIEKIASIDSSVMAAHLQDHTSPIATHAPGLAQHVQQKTMVATKFLIDKLPPQVQKSSLTPQLDKQSYSPSERATYLRYVDAVEGGPEYILKRFANGHGTLEDVEVLQKVFPESMGDIKTKIVMAASEKSKPIDYQSRLQIGTLLGAEADPSLNPVFIYAMQSSYPDMKGPQAPATSPKGAPSNSPANLSIVKSGANIFDQAAQGN